MNVLVFHRGHGSAERVLCEGTEPIRTISASGVAGDVGTVADPSAVVLDGDVLIFHQDADHAGDLWVTTSSLNGLYSQDKCILSGVLSDSPGAVIDDDGHVLIFHQQPGDVGWLALTRFTGPSSATSAGFTKTGITGSPRSVSFSGSLWTFHRGHSDEYGNAGQLFYNIGKKTDTPEKSIPSARAACNPAPVVYKGELLVFYQGENKDGNLYMARLLRKSMQGDTWRTECVAAGVISESPAAVVTVDRNGEEVVEVYYQGPNDDGSLWMNTFDGARWLGQRRLGTDCITGGPSVVVAP